MDGENTFYKTVVWLCSSPFTYFFGYPLLSVKLFILPSSLVCVKHVTFIISTRYWLLDLYQSGLIPGHGAPTPAAVFTECEGGTQGLLPGLGSLVSLQIAPLLFRSMLHEHQDRWTCMEYFKFVHFWCFLQNDSWDQQLQHLRETTAELAGDMLTTTSGTKKT